MKGDYIDKIARRGKSEPEEGEGEAPDAVVVVASSGYGKVKQRALDDLAAALAVPKEARADFDGALVDLIEACMKDGKRAPEPEEESEPVADSEE